MESIVSIQKNGQEIWAINYVSPFPAWLVWTGARTPVYVVQEEIRCIKPYCLFVEQNYNLFNIKL